MAPLKNKQKRFVLYIGEKSLKVIHLKQTENLEKRIFRFFSTA